MFRLPLVEHGQLGLIRDLARVQPLDRDVVLELGLAAGHGLRGARGVPGERVVRARGEEGRLQTRQLGDHLAQRGHLARDGGRVRALAESVGAELPPQQALGALDDRHHRVAAQVLVGRLPRVRRELEELEHRPDRTLRGHHRAQPRDVVGDREVRVARRRLLAVHRVRIDGQHVGRVHPRGRVAIGGRDGHREGDPAGIEGLELAVVLLGLRDQVVRALVHDVVTGGSGMLGELADVTVVHDPERVRSVPSPAALLEAVAGLEVHDLALPQHVHQRVHGRHGRPAEVVVQVQVDRDAVEPPLAAAIEQLALPLRPVRRVAEAGVVDAEHEARDAVDEQAALGVQRGPRRLVGGGDAGHDHEQRDEETGEATLDHGVTTLQVPGRFRAAARPYRHRATICRVDSVRLLPRQWACGSCC